MGEVTSMWVKTTSNIYREVGRYFRNNRRLHQGARAETANVVMSGDGGVTTCTVEPCILEQIDYLWGLAVAKPMI